MQFRRVVVTGMGALTPLGNTLQYYWSGLINGVSGAAEITHFDPSKFKTKFACEVKGFDPLNYFDRKESRKLDTYSHYAVAASEETWRRCFSKSTTVESPNWASSASWDCVISSIARAARHCAGVIFNNFC